ncbi:hypothetical protein NC651_036413 [Populus alba x Populus x berolinensis]|nr:hypothetical protein NC651_036413 [Populus alba x Populus x berolinensis]
MATHGYCLAEAYVLRRLHNYKLKRMDEEKAKMDDDDDELDLEVNCFLSISQEKKHGGWILRCDWNQINAS